MTAKTLLLAAALLVAGIAVGFGLNGSPAAQAQRGGEPFPVVQRYTVLQTDGTNLLVTDHKTNTFYFYTIDDGAEIGSELKLRGSVDLNAVGQPTIQPKVVAKKKG